MRVAGITLLGQDGLDQDGLGHLAWPGVQDGLGQGRLRLKWAKGRFGSKNDEKIQVLGMDSLQWKSLADLRRVFLAHLEAPNSSIVKATTATKLATPNVNFLASQLDTSKTLLRNARVNCKLYTTSSSSLNVETVVYQSCRD